MSVDPFYEDGEPRTLFFVRRELIAPHRKLDVELHTKTHTTRVVSQKVRREAFLEGKPA